MEKYFHHDKEEIIKIFNEGKEVMPVTDNPEVDKTKTTTEILAEGSERLLKEEREFLEEISKY